MPAPHPPEFRRRAVELARQADRPLIQLAKELDQPLLSAELDAPSRYR